MVWEKTEAAPGRGEVPAHGAVVVASAGPRAYDRGGVLTAAAAICALSGVLRARAPHGWAGAKPGRPGQEGG